MEVKLREWQQQKLAEALNGLRTKRTVLLNVPTGAGKTLFSLLLGKNLNKKVLFLTRTHSEFEAVRREAERLGLKVTYLFGKSSICPFATEDTDPEDIDCKACTLQGKTKDLSGLTPSQILQVSREASDFCPYYSLMAQITKADVVTASYLYYFVPFLRAKIICKSSDCLNPDNLLVVVDEAHNLINADEWFAKEITKKTVSKALKELGEVEKKADKSLDYARQFLLKLDQFMGNITDEGGCKELPAYPEPSDYELLELRSAMLTYINMTKGPIKKSSLKTIFNFFNMEGITFNCGGKLVKIPPNSFELVSDALSKASMRILMSGTLPELGIDGHRITVQLKMGRAEYYYCNSVTSKVRLREQNAPKYAEIIKKVYNSSASNVLVFFVSYDFKDLVRQHLSGIPILEETKRVTHEEVLELMRNGKYAVLLVVRAKESEGVEFRANNKNLFDSMILAGLPYPDVTDALVRRRITNLANLTKRSEEDIRRELTVITVKQTIGRAFRDPNDFAKIFLCDYRYKDYFNDLGISEKDVKPFE